MPNVFVRLAPFRQETESAVRAYHIAGCRFWIDADVPVLEAFRERRLPTPRFAARVLPRAPVDAARGAGERRVSGWVGGRREAVRCRQLADGYVIQVKSVRFFVRDDGKWIERLDPGPSDADTTHLFLGPVLVLALALQGRWCLHGGAVIREGSALVFVGESGLGKSTIAAELAGTRAAMRRLADDVVPVAMNGRLHSLPPFPQPKLSDAQQYAESAPVGVAHIYVLRPGTDETPVAHGLSAAEAALAVARHTVSAQLFPQALLAGHLAFCARVAETTRVTALEYPHTRESLDTLTEMIAHS